MSNRAAHISKIQTYLYDKLRKVSDNVYAGTLPSTLDSNVTDMIAIDCGLPIYDKSAYNNGAINIYLYATPTKKGQRNVTILGKLEDLYDEFLEDSDNENYTIVELYRIDGYDSNYNLHYIMSAINIIVS
jgi:hypothetical protein